MPKMHAFFNTITGKERLQEVEQMLRSGPSTVAKVMRDVPELGPRDAGLWKRMQAWAKA